MKRVAQPGKISPDSSAAVEAFLLTLDHPLKKEIEAARKLILDVSPQVSEGIKWNAPSFRTTEYFATTHLRSTDKLQFILHLGAKVRKPVTKLVVDDPAGLLKWLSPDRCLVTLGSGKAFTTNKSAFVDIVRQWIKYV